MIGIICAMNKEACGIIERMTEVTTEEISRVTFNKGKINGKDCVVAVCGIGKVFAALCAQTMILRYSPSLIINTGVAGGLDKTLKVCDIAVATSLVQHDMDTSPLGDPKGLISGINIVNIPTDKNASDALISTAKACGASVGVSTTGIAGPGGGTPTKPVGTVYVGACIDGAVFSTRLNIDPSLSRDAIRNEAVRLAIEFVIQKSIEIGKSY